jgi:hypothetical protein
MLSAQTQTLDQGAVTVDVNALEVIKHTTTVADHQQQTTTGVVIVLVLLEVLGQISDALGEQSNLDLRGAGVTLVGCVGLDDFLLFLSRKCHGILLILLRGAAGPIPARSLSAGETRQGNILHDVRTKIAGRYFRPPRRRLFFTSRHGREQTAEQHHGKRDEFDCEEQ